MPRDGGPARLRLRQAALELYEQRGFDQVTIAEIAARAGVTERTFYRHFADKREVLFDGEAALRDVLVAAVADAPGDLEPLPTLLWSFRCAASLFEGNRRFSEPLRRVIADTPALRERQQTKTALLTEALAAALRERGTGESTAALAAQVGMAAFSQAAAAWFRQPDQDPDKLLADVVEDLRALTAPLAAKGPRARPDAAVRGAAAVRR
ncbi:TetR/AcrR family transcriptional regulator [Actinocrinis puniceicyclus]|uniref:TetR/AcrR family transcriptional regulator n=1 Tax=Actinocrinis puniceicyclus TaxID=977794 RepID=A0A8J7WPK0_9ACTN|nr:TetR/AcrR family transcriptional regulator [Actinocrinis puniceicyclus]MBS2966193.1 TetR/AcrR family transcriptional regulator [Actinocrinis puniceicyclus]